MQSGWISKNKGFVSTSSLAATDLHFVVVVVFLIFSRHFLFTLAVLILVKNCGLVMMMMMMMMMMVMFQILKTPSSFFGRPGLTLSHKH